MDEKFKKSYEDAMEITVKASNLLDKEIRAKLIEAIDKTNYRRSPQFVIFGTRGVSRNSGITSFETHFSTKIPKRVQKFSKTPIFC